MTDQFLANLLGVNADRLLSTAPRHGTFPALDGRGSFAGALDAALEREGTGDAAVSGAAVVASVGARMAGLLQRISAATDVGERRALALEFRAEVIGALRGAGLSAAEGSSPDKIVVEGQLYDIIRSLNSPGAQVAAQFFLVEDAGGTGSISGVVFGVGQTHGYLLAKMNSATTVEERLQWAEEMRDAVIEALKAAGHTAFEIGKADKIVVDGSMYDILRNVDGVGMLTALQLLPLGEYGEGGSGDARSAIFAAGAPYSALLSQISASSNLEERRSLAEQLREKVIDALTAAGFDASVGSGPDKLVVGGVIYDFIRSLNSPGTQAYLQALVVA